MELMSLKHFAQLTYFEKVGVTCITIVGIQISRIVFRNLYIHVLGPKIKSATVLRDQGKWAVVIEAHDAIGKAYSMTLAAEGLNIIMISRHRAIIQAIADTIEKTYFVETRLIIADLTKVGDTYAKIEKGLEGYEIGVLINNTGPGYQYPEYFLDIPYHNDLFRRVYHQTYSKILNSNVFAVTNMCRLVMPGMVKRGRGVVINVASSTAVIPSPLLTVYGASKAFVLKFSEDLLIEYGNKGIIIQCLIPAYVSKCEPVLFSFARPSADTYVKTSLKTIGYEDKTNGWFAHTVMLNVIHIIDYFSKKLANRLIMRILLNSRDKAFRRYYG